VLTRSFYHPAPGCRHWNRSGFVMKPGMPRLVAALSLAAALGLPGCGQNTLDTKSVEKAIADNIAKQIGDRPRSVVCPDSIAAKKGGTFTCRVIRSDGKTVLVKAVQRNDKGDFVFAPASRQPKP
jgi:molybdopterin biosynthesis enzyme